MPYITEKLCEVFIIPLVIKITWLIDSYGSQKYFHERFIFVTHTKFVNSCLAVVAKTLLCILTVYI